MKAVVLCAALLGLLLCASLSWAREDICRLRKATGRCRAMIPKFYFNEKANKCQRFYYGGCGGNANRFNSESECKRTCTLKLSANPLCNLPKAAGMCMAYMPSFFYNTWSGQCESFVYGGCQGNANRFISQSDCEDACHSAPKLSPNPQCNLPKVVGPCRALMPSFFYNTQTGQCESFNYGGCQGNANRFSSSSECQTACAGKPSTNPKCNQPKVVGPCRALIPSFFYSATTGQCESFNYGGCQGNANRFQSLSACQRSCL